MDDNPLPRRCVPARPIYFAVLLRELLVIAAPCQAGANHGWLSARCSLCFFLLASDSDGDGQSNGFELGDPCCVWTSASGASPRAAHRAEQLDADEAEPSASLRGSWALWARARRG